MVSLPYYNQKRFKINRQKLQIYLEKKVYRQELFLQVIFYGNL